MYLLALYTNLNPHYRMQMLFRRVNKFLQCRHNMLSIDNTVQSEIHAGLENSNTVFLLKG